MAFKYGGPPIHPGEILREDYLVPLGMSENDLAKHLKVSVSRVNEIVRGRRGVTAETALRLARFFGGNAQSWLNLQSIYDLRTAENESSEQIKEIVPAAMLARETRRQPRGRAGRS